MAEPEKPTEREIDKDAVCVCGHIWGDHEHVSGRCIHNSGEKNAECKCTTFAPAKASKDDDRITLTVTIEGAKALTEIIRSIMPRRQDLPRPLGDLADVMQQVNAVPVHQPTVEAPPVESACEHQYEEIPGDDRETATVTEQCGKCGDIRTGPRAESAALRYSDFIRDWQSNTGETPTAQEIVEGLPDSTNADAAVALSDPWVGLRQAGIDEGTLILPELRCVCGHRRGDHRGGKGEGSCGEEECECQQYHSVRNKNPASAGGGEQG